MQINDSWKVLLCAWMAFEGFHGVALSQTQEAPESVEPPLQITSDGANRYEGGIYYAKDNVVVTYGGDVLMADEVHFNPQSKEAMDWRPWSGIGVLMWTASISGSLSISSKDV